MGSFFLFCFVFTSTLYVVCSTVVFIFAFFAMVKKFQGQVEIRRKMGQSFDWTQ